MKTDKLAAALDTKMVKENEARREPCEGVSRVYVLDDDDVGEARFIVDWSASARGVSAEDVARVARVAVEVKPKPFEEDRPAVLLVSSSLPDEETQRAAIMRGFRILVVEKGKEGFGYRRSLVNKVRIEAGARVSAAVSKALGDILRDEDQRAPRLFDAGGATSVSALEMCLPLGGKLMANRVHAFPAQAAKLKGKARQPIREVSFSYCVELRPLRGKTYEAAVADHVAGWVFG